METLKGLSTGRKVVLGAAVLLLIFTFFAWQKVSVSLGDFGGVSASANAWHGFWGILLGLATIAIIAWVGVRALGIDVPLSLPDGLVTLALGAIVLAAAVLKNLIDDYSAWASYVGLVLAAGVAYGAWLVFSESGESLPQRSSAAAAPMSGPPAAEPPAAEPPPERPTSDPA
jgi:hypothetical protein